MYKLIFLFSSFAYFSPAFCQDPFPDSHVVDDSTLYYYNSYQYKPLIELGNKSIENHIDYYYLRYRIAMAQQQLGRYTESMGQAAEALKKNANDPYLYNLIAFNAYMLGKTEEQHFARVGENNLFDTSKVYRRFQPVQFVYTETAIKRTTITSVNDLYFFQAGLQSALSRRLFLYQGYSTLSQSVYWGEVKQWQYYAKLTTLLSLTTKINGAFHYLSTNTTTKEPPSRSTTANYVALISAEHQFDKFSLKGNVALADLNNSPIWQYGLNGSYSPFGNSLLTFAADVQLQSMNGAQTLFVKPEATVSLFRNTWISMQYFWVNGFNSIESDAFLVNNSYDKTIDRAQILLNYRLNDHFSFYGVYQHERKIETSYNIDYAFNTFLLGLKISR